MSHVLRSQHNSGLVFWTHVFISTQKCSIIWIMCRCEDCKANTWWYNFDCTSSLYSNAPKPFIFLIWSQILEGHSICPFDLHLLVEQCLIHYDENTNFWLVFWPHAFTSTQPCSIIQIMCRCKYDKANTNTCHVLWLVRVVLFKDCTASLIVIFTLPLKMKAMHVLHKSVSYGSILTKIHADFDFTIDFEEALSEIPPTRKTTRVLPVEPASGTSPVEPTRRLRFIDGFKLICSARSMGNIFNVQIWIIYINIVACKMCVITRVRSWMGSMFPDLDPWLPNIFQALPNRKVRFVPPKDITICWRRGLHATN